MNTNLALFGILLLTGTVSYSGHLAPEAAQMLFDMRWYMLLCLAISALDFYYGVKESRQKGEEVRTSRALRRTLDKTVSFVLWLLVAGCFYQAFGQPFGDENHVVTAITMGVCIFIELKSVAGHIAYLYNLHMPLGKTVGKIIGKTVGRKVDADLGQSIEETAEELSKEKEQKDNGSK